MFRLGLQDCEARLVIENSVQDADLAIAYQLLVATHQGDREATAQLLEQYELPRQSGFFDIIIRAWSGRRDEVNREAAEIDEHYFGAIVLWQLANWCLCGSPWELEVTPNFAAKIEEANMTWPPKTPLSFPLKDW